MHDLVKNLKMIESELVLNGSCQIIQQNFTIIFDLKKNIYYIK